MEESNTPIQSKKKKGLLIGVILAIIVVVILLVFLLSPALSPLASIRDTDEDGYADSEDAFPDNPLEWTDTDSDGVGDNGDAFPNDPNEQEDSDSDGIGNNADFYDQGNGKIKIAITSYQGDGSGDFWTNGDPFFKIYVDTDNDGLYDENDMSHIFVDTETLSNPFYFIVDIPDDTETIRFLIEVWESDLEGDYEIDYTPSPTGIAYVNTVSQPFSASWTYDGDDDLLNELDCELSYSISVIGG